MRTSSKSSVDISVLSNILPKKTCEICKKYFAGDIEGACKLQYDLHALTDSLFSEVNPIPVKSAVAHLGFCENSLRLPLTTMDEGKEKIMLELMRKQGLNV